MAHEQNGPRKTINDELIELAKRTIDHVKMVCFPCAYRLNDGRCGDPHCRLQYVSAWAISANDKILELKIEDAADRITDIAFNDVSKRTRSAD